MEKNVPGINTFASRELAFAKEIAEKYLEQNPREVVYCVELASTEDDSIGLYYHALSDEEKAIITDWKNDEAGVSLDEYLEDEGHIELRDRLLENDSVYPLNILESCNLKDTAKFTEFSMHEVDVETGKVSPSYPVRCPLTDEEYVDLMAELIRNPEMTMNQFVFKLPELARKIIEHATLVTCFDIGENGSNFILTFDEIKNAVMQILDPLTNSLKMFDIEDEEKRDMMTFFAYTPKDFEIFTQYGSPRSERCNACFAGKELVVAMSELVGNDIYSSEFRCNAIELCEKYRFKDFIKLREYLRRNFNKEGAFEAIRQWVKDQGLEVTGEYRVKL